MKRIRRVVPFRDDELLLERLRHLRMGTAKGPINRRRRKTVIDNLGEVLPTNVQKSYFMLSDAERTGTRWSTARRGTKAGQIDCNFSRRKTVVRLPAIELWGIVSLYSAARLLRSIAVSGCSGPKTFCRSGALAEKAVQLWRTRPLLVQPGQVLEVCRRGRMFRT